MLSDEIAIFLEIVISIIVFIIASSVIMPLVIAIIGAVLLIKGSKEKSKKEQQNKDKNNKNKKLNTKQIVGIVIIVLGIHAFLAALITIIKIYSVN